MPNANLSSVSSSTVDRKLGCFEEKLQSPVAYIHHIFFASANYIEEAASRLAEVR